ncbi:alpha/beta fold hydrolase [Methanocella sp. MCL-LM]|uniref:alpha/beta fold hydrolase n=1 Tax=Methanocella sp. MCL-LM TaxID=3412035 RepID=UPI003C74C776
MTPTNSKTNSPHQLAAIWRDRRIGIAIAVFVAVLFGILVALAMPRGPATNAGALFAMFGGLVAGLIAGLAMRSRWAMLLAPVAYWIVVEIAWLGVPGMTVDGVRVDNMYAIMALILGRGFHALLVLVPMILGASLGAYAARRLSGQENGKAGALVTIARWAPTALVSVLLIALAVVIVLPATTPAILGADGKPVPGSIAELTTVKLGGHDQAISIRGQDTSKPVLLYLAGGPGQSDLAMPRVLYGDLEKDFVVVCWDQRGTGKSYSSLDPASTLTFEQAVSDTIELTNYLRERFREDKIYLMGESYGTVLGVKAVQQRPDLYNAYIGSGQMVSIRETDRRLYYDLLDYANRTGDEQLSATMKAYGEPPYKDPYAGAIVATYYDKLGTPYTPPAKYTELKQASGIGPLNNLAGEYTLVEKVGTVRGLMDVYSIMYPQLQEIDLRKDANRLYVPVYILDAEYELPQRRDLATEWYNQLDAPQKRIITIHNAGHGAAMEGFEEFTRVMNETVLPETYPGR